MLVVKSRHPSSKQEPPLFSRSSINMLRAREIISMCWPGVRRERGQKQSSLCNWGPEEAKRCLKEIKTTRPKSTRTVMAVTRISMKSLAKFGFCMAILFTSVAGEWPSVIDLPNDGNVPSINISSLSAPSIWWTQTILAQMWSPEYSNELF